MVHPGAGGRGVAALGQIGSFNYFLALGCQITRAVAATTLLAVSLTVFPIMASAQTPLMGYDP